MLIAVAQSDDVETVLEILADGDAEPIWKYLRRLGLYDAIDTRNVSTASGMRRMPQETESGALAREACKARNDFLSTPAHNDPARARDIERPL